MAGELNALRDGYPIALLFSITDPAANATTLLTTSKQGGRGWVVPAGYVFHPMVLAAASNAAVTAGTAIFNVCVAGVAIANGPTAQLDTTNTQENTGVQRLGAAPIAAGSRVAVNIVASAGYLPVTADHDVILSGVLAIA